MKFAIAILALFCATCAFGQTLGGITFLSSQPVGVQFASNPRRAVETPMGREQSLLAGSSFMHAKGERPLWEFGTALDGVSLGDVARKLKKEHESAKKAEIVWAN